MSVHTIIESYSAYETVRFADPHGNRVWWTTSPFLLTRLPELGEEVRTPEQGLSVDDFDTLALAGRDLVKPVCALLRTKWDWNSSIDLERLIGSHLVQCIFVTLYKGFLLDRILADAGDQAVVCVGDTTDSAPVNLSLAYGRFETLFARLVSIWVDSGIQVVEHKISRNLETATEHALRYRRFGPYEKLLSLLSNTPSSFLYKIWRRLVRLGLWPWEGITFSLSPVRSIHILKDSELIEEAFLGILRRGGRVTRLSPIQQRGTRKVGIPPTTDAVGFKEEFRALCLATLQQRKMPWRAAFLPCVEMLANRIFSHFTALNVNLPDLQMGFANISATMKPGDEVVSSSINGLVDRLFADHCTKRGIRVNTVDHGVTLGLSEWSQCHAAHTGMGVGSRGFYHSRRGASAVSRYFPLQESYSIGLPSVTAHPPMRELQRRLARRLLNADREEHVVMIVCDLERNNYVYGPKQDNDFLYLKKTRQITEAVCARYPESMIVLKLYPTQRYLDAYDFCDLASRFKNIRILKDFEFRFIRTAADLIITTSTQSTLGWVLGAGVPYIYLDFEWAPGLISGRSVAFPQIDGMIKAINPDVEQICEPGLLNLAELLLCKAT